MKAFGETLSAWRLVLLLILLVSGLGSAWLLRSLESGRVRPPGHVPFYEPDMYMTHPEILTMDETGRLVRRLVAERLSRYPGENTVELVRPRVTLLQGARQPLRVRAEQGWLVSGDQVAFLHGDVHLEQTTAGGESVFSARTERVGVLLDAEYAQTGAEVALHRGRVQLRALGMVAHLGEGRLEFARHLQTRITPVRDE